MKVTVRDIHPKYVEEISKRCTELKNKTGQKWSQNDYLKSLIQNDFHRPLMDYKKDEFDKTIERISTVLIKNTQVLEEYIETTNKLVTILIGEESGENNKNY